MSGTGAWYAYIFHPDCLRLRSIDNTLKTKEFQTEITAGGLVDYFRNGTSTTTPILLSFAEAFRRILQGSQISGRLDHLRRGLYRTLPHAIWWRTALPFANHLERFALSFPNLHHLARSRFVLPYGDHPPPDYLFTSSLHYMEAIQSPQGIFAKCRGYTRLLRLFEAGRRDRGRDAGL